MRKCPIGTEVFVVTHVQEVSSLLRPCSTPELQKQIGWLYILQSFWWDSNPRPKQF